MTIPGVSRWERRRIVNLIDQGHSIADVAEQFFYLDPGEIEEIYEEGAPAPRSPSPAGDEGSHENVHVEREGNYLRLVADGTWEAGYVDGIAFLERMGFDPAEWDIRWAKPNSWPTSGWDGANERPWTVINHQTKATLLPLNLRPLEPQVQPVKIRARRRKGKKPGRQHHGLKTALIVTDPHFGYLRDMKTGELTPFHDRRVLDIALQLTMRLRPEEIVWAGDTFDLADWSDKFVRSPAFYHTTQPAVLEASWWLARFRSAARPARITVLEGNHDLRLEKALLVHLNNVYQLRPADEMELPPAMSVPRLLALHKMDIEYVDGYPDSEMWLADNLIVAHGAKARSAPGATVGAQVRESDTTMIIGHIHRREWASRTQHGRHSQRIIEAFCPGCSCHVDGRVPGKKKKQNWQQGLAVVRFDGHTIPSITPVSIQDGRAIFEGEVFEGDEEATLEGLRQDVDWEF